MIPTLLVRQGQNGLAAIVLIAAVACTPAGSEQPTSSTSATTSPSTVVGFPDLSKFIEADQHTYFSSGQRYSGIAFQTPSGMICSSNDYPERKFARITCWGPLPGKPGQWELVAEQYNAATIKDITARAPVGASEAGTSQPTTVLLPTRHVVKRTEDALVCGIIDNGTPACRIGDHGFALTTDQPLLF
ncbi:hypothetical protein [Mycolicibacterium llatzerense]|uniref:hypothetical protein n=1 Tax=Mycolicibacterium llatzerense TaxID=280871 RepID=UPI0021B6E39F|nr:hypothetical protein [Mycolicibacterium llatzerense]